MRADRELYEGAPGGANKKIEPRSSGIVMTCDVQILEVDQLHVIVNFQNRQDGSVH